jgi:hypothetical protein
MVETPEAPLEPVLRHRRPCDECPWRRKAPAGHLGGYDPEEYVRSVQYDAPLACHKTFGPDGETDNLSFCAGALIFMRNSCKMPRDPDIRFARSQVEEDTENVFQWPHEFTQHHKDPEGWAKRVIQEMKDND